MLTICLKYFFKAAKMMTICTEFLDDMVIKFGTYPSDLTVSN